MFKKSSLLEAILPQQSSAADDFFFDNFFLKIRKVLIFTIFAGYSLFFIWRFRQPGIYYILLLIAASSAMIENFFNRKNPLRNKNEVLSYTTIFLTTVFAAIIILAHVQYFVIQPYRVNHKSMLPGIKPGEIVAVEKISMGLITNYYRSESKIRRLHFLWERPLQPGDILIFRKPGDNDILIKRLGHIENNTYCVYGDNSEYSVDSRVFGCIPENKIIGRYVFTFPNYEHFFARFPAGAILRFYQ